MNKTIFIKNLKESRLIAHRLGYKMTDYPENSMMVLKTIFNNRDMLDACNGFEFDICFTKDNIPIVMHDKYIDDISDSFGLVKSYTLEELKKINFGFRKSLNNTEKSITFKIITLEEILIFFKEHLSLLKDKIIKIETKEAFKIYKKNMEGFAEIINKFSCLHNNIIHLSFWPQNLIILKKIQKNKNYFITKSDLLCDYNIMVSLSRYITSLDGISLRIKTDKLPKIRKGNSKRVNMKIVIDYFFMKFSNAINKKTLKFAFNKYNSVGLYVLNSLEEIDTIAEIFSDDFFKENLNKISFTTDDPLYLKKI